MISKSDLLEQLELMERGVASLVKAVRCAVQEDVVPPERGAEFLKTMSDSMKRSRRILKGTPDPRLSPLPLGEES